MTSEQILKKYTNWKGEIPLNVAETETEIYYLESDKASAICRKLKIKYARVHVGYKKGTKFSKPIYKGCCVANQDIEIVIPALEKAEHQSIIDENIFYNKKIDVFNDLLEKYPSTPSKCIDKLIYYINSDKIDQKATINEIYSFLCNIHEDYAYYVANGCQSLLLHPNLKKELYRHLEGIYSLWSQPGQFELVDLPSKNSLTATNVHLPLDVMWGKPELVKRKIVEVVSEKLCSEGFTCISDEFISEAEQTVEILELSSKYVQLTYEQPVITKMKHRQVDDAPDVKR